MKTRILKIRNFITGFMVLFLLLLTSPAYSQSCSGNGATLSIGNFSQTSTTIEYDIYVKFTTSVANSFDSYGGNVIYNSGLLPAGATGTLTVVDQPNAAQFPGIAAATVNPTHNVAARSLRWTFLPSISPASSAPLMTQNVVYKFARFRFTSSLPWTTSSGTLAFNHNSAGGNTLNIVRVYCNGNTASSSISLANLNLTLSTGQTQNTPFTFTLNPVNSCPTEATAGSLVAEGPCAGAANGSAVITLTGAPNASASVTYTVDGGATQNATLSSSAFTVSGLSAGNHVIAVTYPSCAPISTGTFNIGAGTPLTTNGSVTTSICSGGSYTWPANGVTYTTAQSGTTFTSGCNTATLNLAILAAAETYYADSDGDGFGSGPAILSCSGQPANTSTNNTDCAPTNPLKWRTSVFYVDADNDSYSNGLPASIVCYGTSTLGYSLTTNGVDCNDNDASVNPNASEILDNDVDENCDGTLNEITPLSTLTSEYVGATLTTLDMPIFASMINSFPGVGTVTGYRWRVTNGSTVTTIDTPTNRFSLMQIPGGVAYNTTYTIEVSVRSNGFYRAFGPPAMVTTPPIPRPTYVSNPMCGSTLTDLSQSIFCEIRAGASGYRFRVRNGSTIIGTVDKTTNRFSLLDLGVNNISFGTTYTIDVLLAFAGSFRPDSEYGSTCSVSTPATLAASQVVQPLCGSTINSLWTTIFARQITGAQGYKFVVTNGAQTREYATSNPRFQLPLLSGGATANTAYTIRVDVLYNSSYVQGTVLCTITTSPTATRQANAALDIYEVSAYPNPYAETFKLNVNTSSEDQVGVKVYDILGREVESRQATVSAITNLEIGSQYPSGVYNIIVTQGDNVKTVRVIKR